MKNILVNGKYEALDGEYEADLKHAYLRINAWKRSYFRKNSKNRATIRLLIDTKKPSQDWWKHWLQLFINGELIDRFRIRDEASDTLSRNLPEENLNGSYIYIIATFEPAGVAHKTK